MTGLLWSELITQEASLLQRFLVNSALKEVYYYFHIVIYLNPKRTGKCLKGDVRDYYSYKMKSLE